MKRHYILSIIIILIYLTSCERKLDLKNAHISKYPVADFENIFSEAEYSDLLNKIIQIKSDFNIEIYILTVKSFNEKEYSIQESHDKIDAIFNLTNKSDIINKPIVIFLLSHTENNRTSINTIKFRNLVDEDSITTLASQDLHRYFNNYEYYYAYRTIIDIIEYQLKRNNKI